MLVRAKKARATHKAQGGRPPTPVPAESFTFPAPILGWVLNENLATPTPTPGGARILDNWVCTTRGARVRGGATIHATLSDDVTALFDYNSATSQFFAATTTSLHDVSVPADAEVAVEAGIVGLTSGDWSVTQFGTAGGDYLVAVNGADPEMIYDGATWNPVNGAAVNQVAFDAQTLPFAVGQTVTGGASGATAVIVSVQKLTATTGRLKLGAITGGPFLDDETLTTAGGAAVANGGSSSASAIAITGVATSSLSQVWSYGSRLFYTEKDSLNAWYLPVDSLGGTAAAFPLAGIFTKGGTLLFGAKWSLDAGDGLDDKCVFVSSEGEVAIYEGTNPGSAADWRKAGLYTLPRPLGKKAYTTAGGDLLIATEVGLIPVSAALQTDLSAIESKAVSQRISPYWQSQSAKLSSGWEMVKVPDSGVMFVSQPADNTALAINLLTGAWSRVTGWDARCLGRFGGSGYFGTAAGQVARMESGGSDLGAIYTAVIVGQYDPMRFYGRKKSVLQMRAMFQVGTPIVPQLRAMADFGDTLSAPPSSPAAYATDGWDVGLWDVAVWDATTSIQNRAEWVPVGVTGSAIAYELQLTFGVAQTPVVELVSIDAEFHVGAMVA